MNALKDDWKANLATHFRFIDRAAKQKCDLILFPELSVTGHFGDEAVVEFAEAASEGPIAAALTQKARQLNMFISYGFCELANGTHYNSQALVGPGGLAGIQRKVHASKDEYFYFRMGRSLDVFDIGACRIGTLICFDSCFSEAWRVLALKGADVILLPHACRSGSGIRIPAKKQAADLRTELSRLPGSNGVYARENGVFAVYANQADFNGHSTHSGGAYVLDPFGGLISRSRVSLEDHMIIAELDGSLLSKARRSPHYTVKVRRPELYGEIAKMM